MFRKIRRKIKTYFYKQNKWEQIEYFHSTWNDRISKMATFIPHNSMSILDLGCGKMWLKEIIPDKLKYYGVDYKERGDHTIICDFNKKQFPNISVDVCFISGCLEYVNNPKWFIRQVFIHSNSCILSYCTVDYFPDMRERKVLAWVNHFTDETLITLFKDTGFKLVRSELAEKKYTIYEFKK